MSRKVQIEFDDHSLARVDVLRVASRRRTIADVVRDALALYAWCQRAHADGFVIAAVKGDKTREVVLPFEISGEKKS